VDEQDETLAEDGEQDDEPLDPVRAAEYECPNCRRGRCARCTDEQCSCCGGVPFGDDQDRRYL